MDTHWDAEECNTLRHSGLSPKQWAMLFLAFVLGIACVFTLDKTIMARDSDASNAVRAATVTP